MTQVSPDYPITLAGKSFTLDGSFATLRSVQQAFRRDLIDVQASVLDMRQDEIAQLLAAATGGSADEYGALLLDEIGVTSPAYQMVKAHLMAWLAIAMSPKADREAARARMGELIGRLAGPPASPGPSTRSSPSASSAGRRTRSGGATSGR